MAAPDAPGPPAARWRLAGIGLLALGVAAALYVAGRLHQPDYTFSMFGADPIAPKSLLATIALVLAGVQVLLALWIYRRLPLAGSPPRPVPAVHRVTGFVLFALTVPVAVHCLIAYGVQLTSLRVAIHSIAGCFFYGAFAAKVLLCTASGCPDGRCRRPAGRSPSSSACSGTPQRCGTTTATNSRTSSRRTDRSARPLATTRAPVLLRGSAVPTAQATT